MADLEPSVKGTFDLLSNETVQGHSLLLYNGGTVCDDSFDNNAATAICREMGYTDALGWTSGSYWSAQDNYEYDISLDEVQCDSGEWEDCSFQTETDCQHYEDVFLSCGGVWYFSVS